MAPTGSIVSDLLLSKELRKLGKRLVLQKKAADLGVNYYTNFRVVSANDTDSLGRKLYFPVVEIYEKGQWEVLVIGGRPYKDKSRARLVLQSAQKAQYLFLTRMSRVVGDNFAIAKLCGRTNPLDHWRYELEG